MNNKMSSVAWYLGIRQATIWNVCGNFGLNYSKGIIGKNEGIELLSPDFIQFLILNKEFLVKYENDHYADKTPQVIANTSNQHLKAVEVYLKLVHPKYYLDGVFTPQDKYSLRHVSSYFVDYELGGNYDILSF
jgi:hypothetical protein